MNNSPDTLRFVPLLNMGKKQAREFSRRVETSQGVVPVFIYPYYLDPRLAGNPKFDDFRTRRDMEISTLLEQSKPVVIFEESHHVNKLQATIENSHPGPLYFVRTRKGDPDPLRSSWDNIAQVLHDTDTINVNMGGTVLILRTADNPWFDGGVHLRSGLVSRQIALDVLRKYVNDISTDNINLTEAYNWIRRDLIPDGCVGKAALELLARGLDVSFTLASYPDNDPLQLPTLAPAQV